MTDKEEKSKDDKIDRLTNLVEKLVELQVKQMETKPASPQPSKEDAQAAALKRQRERADLEESLKQFPLGEVIIFALKKNLIKKSPLSEIQEE